MLYSTNHTYLGQAGMDTTLLELPTELLQAAKLTPEQAKTELAIRLYQSHRLTSQQAAELAGDPNAFKRLLWRDGENGRFDLNGFLDWASHDLKTPLNAVIGFTKVVIKGIDGPINETQSTDLTTAFTSGQRMLSLISQLVEIARLNIGQVTLAREPRSLADFLVETTERWKNLNPSKPLTTDLQIASSSFSVDALHLRQIINHSLTLAAIRITEGTLTFSAREDGASLSVSIQSQGRKSADKMEMDSAMLGFITSSLVGLHGGRMEEPLETDDGLLLSFFLPG
jgi:signal transduction histidine kinase